ncbi:pyridoxal phosphate-dependent transferase [Umbelopsis sp. AD052]|nr:pyridoxal phosphate-dependent transferase [Umbelopsis sp. AD052]
MDISRSEYQAALEHIVQIALDRNDNVHNLPVVQQNPNHQEEEALLTSKPLPQFGQPLEKTISQVFQTVLNGVPNMNGPRYFGWVMGGTTPASIVGDFLTSIYDLNMAFHQPKDTNAFTIEQLALDMVLDLGHIPRETYPVKLLTPGATASNLVGLLLGRQWVAKKRFNIDIAEEGFCGKTIKVIGGSAHSSVIKAVAVAGIGRGNYVDVSLNERGSKWDLKKLEKILKEQKDGDSEASIVSVGCGEVNTGGSTDDIDKIRLLCTKYDAWLHIDATYGLCARAMPSHAAYAAHIELADSMASDAHKWLNVPYDCGLFYSKHMDMSLEMFAAAKASYLQFGKTIIPQPMDIGIETARRFKALPLYMSLLTYGARGYQELFESNCKFAASLGEWIDLHPDFELLSPVYLHTLLFRVSAKQWTHPEGNEEFIDAVKKTGKAHVSSTMWNGKPAIRGSVNNWRTRLDRDLSIVQQALEEAIRSRMPLKNDFN